jgi:hypothetical protein
MKVDKAERDNRIWQLFIAGAPNQQIATAVDCTVEVVEAVIAEQLLAGQHRRRVLTEHRYAVNLERTEALLKAHWGAALRGDHRSAEICNRILERQLAQAHNAPATMEGDAVDEITSRRAARRASTATGTSRARR